MRELKGERTIVCDTCVRVWMNGESRDGRSVANRQKECKLTWQVSQYVFQTFFAMKSGSLHSLHTMGSEGAKGPGGRYRWREEVSARLATKTPTTDAYNTHTHRAISIHTSSPGFRPMHRIHNRRDRVQQDFLLSFLSVSSIPITYTIPCGENA